MVRRTPAGARFLGGTQPMAGEGAYVRLLKLSSTEHSRACNSQKNCHVCLFFSTGFIRIWVLFLKENVAAKYESSEPIQLGMLWYCVVQQPLSAI